jgi:hypothetical protein
MFDVRCSLFVARGSTTGYVELNEHGQNVSFFEQQTANSKQQTANSKQRLS